jgi:hypothetical protein
VVGTKAVQDHFPQATGTITLPPKLHRFSRRETITQS